MADSSQGNRPRAQGPKAYVFAKQDAVKPASELGKYDLSITLGTNHERPMHPVLVKLFVQDQMIDVYPVKEKKDYAVNGFKYDPSKPFEVRIAHVDNPSLTDKIILPPPPGTTPPAAKSAEKDSKSESKASFTVRAALNPDEKNRFRIDVCSTGQDGKPSDLPFTITAEFQVNISVGTGKPMKAIRLPLQTTDGQQLLLVSWSQPGKHEAILIFRAEGFPDQRVHLVR